MSQMSLAIAIFTKSGMGARMSEGSREARGEDSTAAGHRGVGGKNIAEKTGWVRRKRGASGGRAEWGDG